jgi:hypothetical protein
MTRGLPEGRCDPTKIPRIQIFRSRDGFLVAADVGTFPQVETQIGRTCNVRSDQLDRP